MKILFTIKALDDIQGGAERVLCDVASGLSERSHDISVLSFDKPNGQSFYPLAKKVKRLPLGIGDAKRKATLREVITRMIALRQEIKKQNPDVVIAFMHSSFIPTAFALIGTGIPVIASEHIVPEHYHNKKLEYLLLIISGLFVKKITVLSQSIIKGYPKILHRKMYAIANPVRVGAEDAGTSLAQNNSKIILNVGRLTEQKDQETLIKAFALIANDYPEWNVKIVGEGKLRDKLETLVQDLKLENRVSLPGVTSNIAKEYQAAHIFALPSLYESFGLVTAEAMSHKLPCIGFASCPGTNEIITHNENGLLVDGTDRIQSFANGLKQYMNDNTLRKKMGEAGPKTIEQFSPNAIFSKWEALIETSCA